MSNPKVTVVIANHNYGKWLPDAINSAAQQEYDNMSIIVVDDGSTDGSVDILKKEFEIKLVGEDAYEGQVKNKQLICVSHNQAAGPSYARNVGINLTHAFTDIYAILDADDIYLPGKIQKSVENLLQHPVLGAVYTDYDTIDIENNIRVRVYKEPFNRDRLLQECIVHSACVIKKEALANCGVYDPQLRVAEDYDLWLRISEKYMITHIPESLMLVRVGSYNSTNTVSKEVWQASLQYINQKFKKRHNG